MHALNSLPLSLSLTHTLSHTHTGVQSPRILFSISLSLFLSLSANPHFLVSSFHSIYLFFAPLLSFSVCFFMTHSLTHSSIVWLASSPSPIFYYPFILLLQFCLICISFFCFVYNLYFYPCHTVHHISLYPHLLTATVTRKWCHRPKSTCTGKDRLERLPYQNNRDKCCHGDLEH